MKAFYSDVQARHAPAWYVADGCARACPEVPARAEGIRRRLSEGAGFEVAAVGETGGKAGADPWEAIRGVHDAGYLEYLRTIHANWPKAFGTRDVIPETFAGGASRRRVVRRPMEPAGLAGYYCFDMAAPITAGTWHAAVASARCAVRAAEIVASGMRSAYALCRPPGHHAGADYCGGFCYLNNAAIAAEFLLRAGRKRVAILDVDYHHGNGTQDIFYARDDVMFVSVHADPNMQYPYFWGYAEERGEGAGEGFNLNLPVARGCTEKAWFEAVERGMEAIGRCAAEAVVVSFGADVYAQDGIGDFHVTMEGFGELGRRVRTMGLPTVFIQEGGYNVKKIGECVEAVLKGFGE